MKFITSTVPLKTAVGLSVIKSNVSKYFAKSVLAQISVSGDTLTINTESTAIQSEVTLKGNGDGSSAVILVDNLLFLDLLATINTPQVEFEFTENALTFRFGKSSFSIPKMVDAGEMKLTPPYRPTEDEIKGAEFVDIGNWKFIKDHQLFAKAISKTMPQYTYVYMSDGGDVLVGDLSNSVFTWSTKGQLDKNCLLSDTIVNLMTSLPATAQILPHEKSYVITINTDSYSYVTQFTPTYESADTGTYPANDLINMMDSDERDSMTVEISNISTVLNQSNILSKTSSSKDAIIKLFFSKDQIRFKDDHIDCVIPAEGGPTNAYSLMFKTSVLKNIISNCPDSVVIISPIYADNDDIDAINISCNELTITIGAYDVK